MYTIDRLIRALALRFVIISKGKRPLRVTNTVKSQRVRQVSHVIVHLRNWWTDAGGDQFYKGNFLRAIQ